jgi:hypothetical protein
MNMGGYTYESMGIWAVICMGLSRKTKIFIWSHGRCFDFHNDSEYLIAPHNDFMFWCCFAEQMK